VAAVVHGEVLALRPFSWGSDLVARATQRLVLIDRGVDPDALSVPEAGLLELGGAQYADALEGYRAATTDGVAQWLVHISGSIVRGAAVGRQICATI